MLERHPLYPEVEPRETGTLAVDNRHTLYWERIGNPKGVPALFLHGGPGGGIRPANRRNYDPQFFDVTLFDQRGCGRSTPLNDLEGNNTQNLIEDIEKLRKHSELQQKERQFAGNRWQEQDMIFPSSIGTPLEPRNLGKHFEQLLAQAGLPRIRFHDLRHTAATLMLLQGVHPKVVQERLGHSSITLTLDTYSHVLPSMQEEAAEMLDQLLLPIAVKLQ